MIEVNHLSKKYGNFNAVSDINFSIDRGEIVGLLGPNGAGKSTIMNMITGYISITEGNALIDNFDIAKMPEEAKKRIGYLPEIPPLYGEMKVFEYLQFVYELKKVKYARTAHIEEIMSLVGLTDYKNRLIKNLSKGYRQRVGLAGALVGNPDVLILDEPTVGLDPKQIMEIRNLIKRLGKNHTIIFSSHILSEIQAVCEKVIIINKGHLVAKGRIEELQKSLMADKSITLCAEVEKEKLLPLLESIPSAEKAELTESDEKGLHTFNITAEEGKDIRGDIFDAVVKCGGKILEISSKSATLEQVFLMLTENAENENAIELLKSSNKEEE